MLSNESTEQQEYQLFTYTLYKTWKEGQNIRLDSSIDSCMSAFIESNFIIS